jgi:hypothetical protein
MAQISFHAGENFNIDNLSGSGLGFYGAGGFGQSVSVGQYQAATYITNSTGTTQGPVVDNIKFTHANSGEGASSTQYNLLQIPNYLATLNVRFTNDIAVKTQNGKLRIFDRTNINNPASGVTCKVAELVHPWTTVSPNGSGSTSWTTPTGSSVVMDLVASPGISGLRPNGAQTSDTQHDTYLVLSASPDSVGSKTQFGLYVSLEYY